MYDVIFISYNEVQADENWNILKARMPWAIRVHGVKGIHQAHIEAAKKAFTQMIWIVDADAIIVDDFDFSYMPHRDDRDAVYVWRSKNPINDLEYGYGGVKLFPRLATVNMETSKTDMTTSISDKFVLMEEVSNITAFNTDEFSTWRSAFRECAKLASNIIDRQNVEETKGRLDIWCRKGSERRCGNFAIAGAIAGREFGLSNMADLNLINNFEWLQERFDATCK